jgi:hypothetical protein
MVDPGLIEVGEGFVVEGLGKIDADGFGSDGIGDGAILNGHHTASVGAHSDMSGTTIPPRTEPTSMEP